jgi:hypothetical protein
MSASQSVASYSENALAGAITSLQWTDHYFAGRMDMLLQEQVRRKRETKESEAPDQYQEQTFRGCKP